MNWIMNKRKGISLIFVFLLVILFFSKTSEGLSIEVGTGVTSGGLHNYMAWFKDYSGVLFVSSTFPNATGIPYSDIVVTAGCIDEEQVFKLRIYDSDEKAYLKPENEISKGMATRKFYVEPSTDLNNLTWIVQATDDTGFIIFAQITLCFTYDDDVDYRTGRYEEEPLNWEKEKEKLVWRAVRWSAQIFLACIGAVFIGVALARRFYGAG